MLSATPPMLEVVLVYCGWTKHKEQGYEDVSVSPHTVHVNTRGHYLALPQKKKGMSSYMRKMQHWGEDDLNRNV